MVVGYLIATGIETILELGFWSVRKAGSVIYNVVYGEKQDEHPIQMSELGIKELRKEIGELKEMIQNKKVCETTT